MALSCLASDPDMIILQSGESIKVYSLDITPGDNIYYSLSEASDSPIKKMSKTDILIIKKADGTKIDPSEDNEQKQTLSPAQSSNSKVNPNAHEPVTVKSLEPDFVELKIKGYKNPEKFILIEDVLGNPLNARLISLEEKTISIARPRKGMKYNYERILFPEYVDTQGVIYVVNEIDEESFSRIGVNTTLKEIIFPVTLKKIGNRSFTSNKALKSIILPESLEIVGEFAFADCGHGWAFKRFAFEQLYIPITIKKIGDSAFWSVGNETSPNGYFQGFISSMPEWITIGNCKNYGIDENAVEDYERRMRIRK